ncbi:sugar-binding protein [Scopulibacillus cellulosilyticus]|uniref:Sugar-binding protein n=1 Tax=Scopulibacillus cellulosilyticus TaxID=2665665 RepID=A0ABW2Q367_9BACL
MYRYRYVFYAILFTCFFFSLISAIYFFTKTLHSNVSLNKHSSSKKADYHFILIPEEEDNPYWELIEKGAKDAGRKFHVEVEYIGPVQTNVNEQIKAIEKAIASKVDGIITQGIDNPAFSKVVNQAENEGIPVITIDTDAPDSDRSAYIGSNNYRAGYLAGKTLIKDTKGQAVVGIITGNHNENEVLRVKGFKKAVENTPKIKIAAVKSSNISRIQAAEKTYEIYQHYPNVTAFYGTSALDGLGISAVTEQFGKSKDIYILAFDTLPETMSLIKKGSIQAAIQQQPYTMGRDSIKTMVKLLNHQNTSKSIFTKISVIHKGDLFSESSNKYKKASDYD